MTLFYVTVLIANVGGFLLTGTHPCPDDKFVPRAVIMVVYACAAAFATSKLTGI